MSGAGAAGLDCAAVDTLELTGRSLAVEDVERVALSEVRVALGTLAADQIEAYPDRAGLKANAGTEASAFLPLIAQNDVLGVLVMGFATTRGFVQEDVDLHGRVAGVAVRGSGEANSQVHLFRAEKYG